MAIGTHDITEALTRAGSEELTSDSFTRILRAAYQSPDSKRRLREALEDWKPVSSTFSERGNAALLRGYGYYILGMLTEAEEVLARDSKNPWSAYYLVRVLLARQRFENALNTVEAARKKFPDFSPLSFLSIEVYSRSGCEEQVPKILKGLESEFGETSEFAFCFGLYHERLSEYREAIEHYRRAVAIDPTNTNGYFRLGFCLDLSGKGDEDVLDEAVNAYEQCLKVVPPHTNAVINLGILYEDRERYHDAIKCFETVLKYYPNHQRARLFLEDARASTMMFYDREEDKSRERQSQVLKIPVTDFELSVRSRNCLQKMNIVTLGDLIMKSEQELLSYKNFGETSLKEIKEMLSSKGLRLGMGLEKPGGEINQPRNPLEATTDPEILDNPIDEMNLSVRSRRCMERLGVKSVRDLINKTEVQLMSAKNFGMTSLNEIKKKLAELGLRLRS